MSTLSKADIIAALTTAVPVKTRYFVTELMEELQKPA